MPADRHTHAGSPSPSPANGSQASGRPIIPDDPLRRAPLRWTALVGLGLRARLAARAARLSDAAYWRRSTADLQLRVLRSLLERARATELGRKHGFDRLARIDDPAERLRAFRSAVPIGDWSTVRADIERMREGAEPDVLWPGLVRHFAQTSGTTAGDKYIPVSAEMFTSNYRASLDIFAYLIARGVPAGRLLSGRCLFLGGCSDLRASERGIITADLSGLVTPLIRWPLSAVYAPGPRIALIPDWPTKIEAMARATIDQDIRFISGMPSWAGVLMSRVLELAAERGRPVRRLLDLWPACGVFVHGGVRYGPFQRRLGELLTGSAEGDFAHRHELYPASEAFIAMQDRPGEPGLRLLADGGNAFEFIPVESLNPDGSVPPGAEAFMAHEATPGVRYGVVLTTCAGLWRYHIGDVVEFEDVPDRPGARSGSGPARLRIVGRHRHFINAFGENLIVEHIEEAVTAAGRALGLGPGSSLGEFTAGPVYPSRQGPAGLELVIEAPPLSRGQVEHLGAIFDASLKAQNIDYTTKRGADLGMGPPTITPVPPGTFHAWMATRGKLGGQNKCPRCANHRDYIDALRNAAGLETGSAVGHSSGLAINSTR